MLIFESPGYKPDSTAGSPIIYAGVFSRGNALIRFRLLPKERRAYSFLILSLESVFAVTSGAILLYERMTGYEIFGCVVIFIAVIL